MAPRVSAPGAVSDPPPSRPPPCLGGRSLGGASPLLRGEECKQPFPDGGRVPMELPAGRRMDGAGGDYGSG